MNLRDELSWLPKEYTALVAWIVFLAYLFFPSAKYLNGKGRIFFFQLFWHILHSPFRQLSFRIIWVTDQLISCIGPLRDVAYTLCYYFSDHDDIN